MKTKDEILKAIKSGRNSKCLDSRDYGRLTEFFDVADLEHFGFSLKDGAKHTAIEFTEKNILKRLENDVAFGFEKALDQRGISAGLMYEVVKMWMWVLEDDLQDFDNYPMHGLPLFKAVALKYGFDNEIGDDSGGDEKYNE